MSSLEEESESGGGGGFFARVALGFGAGLGGFGGGASALAFGGLPLFLATGSGTAGTPDRAADEVVDRKLCRGTPWHEV